MTVFLMVLWGYQMERTLWPVWAVCCNSAAGVVSRSTALRILTSSLRT
jgi:hypothetical protein